MAKEGRDVFALVRKSEVHLLLDEKTNETSLDKKTVLLKK